MRIILALLLLASPCLAEYKQHVDGRTITETKEAIPVGFYDISHYSTMDARRLEAMREMKRMGVNYIAFPADTNDDATFSLAKELGLGLKIEYNAKMTSVIDKFRGSPQAFAHIPGDDVDIKFPDAASYRLVENEYKRLMPEWITFASNAYIKNVNKFGGISDKIGQQSYPVPDESVAASSYHFKLASEAFAAKNTPFTAHVQTSKWYGKRYPSPAEVTVMSWTAIAWGAHEILYYAFYDYGPNRVTNTDLMTQPLIRDAVKVFITLLRTYEPFFLYGQRQVTQRSSGIDATWTYPAMKRKLTIKIEFGAKTVTFSESTIP